MSVRLNLIVQIADLFALMQFEKIAELSTVVHVLFPWFFISCRCETFYFNVLFSMDISRPLSVSQMKIAWRALIF